MARVVEVEELTQRVQALAIRTEVNIMARLTARILKLERYLPTGIKAELRALTDEELKARIAQLTGVSVEELRAWTREDFRRLKDELLAAQSFPGGFDQEAYAPRPSPTSRRRWRRSRQPARRLRTIMADVADPD